MFASNRRGGTIVSQPRFARQHAIQPFPARYGLRRRRMSDQASTELRMVVLRRPGLRIVQVMGELDMLTAPALRDCLRIQLIMKPNTLVIDLNEVEFLGAAGVRVLMATRRTGELLGCDVLLAGGLCDIVVRALHLSGWSVPGHSRGVRRTHWSSAHRARPA
jgi:anti-anti-sigma factor